ncbi:MAG: hypothetical protein H0A76_08310 [Candidatus Thiodubiliella endoseptemdiera]|uniref:Conjugal transfer protein TrbC n=1 Tax=Candidatus Thiodubiliella endoseptemdiera TaxID=2738886 RepID=A0A853F2W9_9GAMM|nr:hypothetical protein [Candidatus Thiodubiliella endoseptemdiera]
MKTKETISKSKSFLQRNQGTIAIGSVLMLASLDASAWTTPPTTALFYDAYDITVNKFLKGAPGFIAGGALVVSGIVTAAKANYNVGIPLAVAGGVLANADSVITSMGISIGLI